MGALAVFIVGMIAWNSSSRIGTNPSPHDRQPCRGGERMLRALNGQAPFCGCAFRHHRPPRRLLKGLLPRARGGRSRGAAPAPPAKDTWYAEPAKVADNFYFIGTKIHSAWAIVGSDGIIVLEALFDYAAQDEVIGGMKKLGLDTRKVKYIIISHAHADHDGGAKLLQDAMPDAHLVYSAEDWDSVDKAANHAGGKPKHDTVATDGMKFSVGDTSLQSSRCPAILQERFRSCLRSKTTESRCAWPTSAAPRSRSTAILPITMGI